QVVLVAQQVAQVVRGPGGLLQHRRPRLSQQAQVVPVVLGPLPPRVDVLAGRRAPGLREGRPPPPVLPAQPALDEAPAVRVPGASSRSAAAPSACSIRMRRSPGPNGSCGSSAYDMFGMFPDRGDGERRAFGRPQGPVSRTSPCVVTTNTCQAYRG